MKKHDRDKNASDKFPFFRHGEYQKTPALFMTKSVDGMTCIWYNIYIS